MTVDYILHTDRSQGKGKGLVFVKGLCAVNPNNPQDRLTYDQGLEKIMEGRKFRFNDPIINETNNKIIIPLGVTNWSEYERDANRFKERKIEEIEKIKQKGLELYEDEFAFFSRALGMEVLPITSDGYALMGPRSEECQFYRGNINSVPGFISFRSKKRLDRLNPKVDVRKKLYEKLGIGRKDLAGEPTFIGIVSHPLIGGMGILYIQRINKEKDYFKSGRWKEEVSKKSGVVYYDGLILVKDIDLISTIAQKGKIEKNDLNSPKIKVCGELPTKDSYTLEFTTRQILKSLSKEDLRPS